MTFRQIGCGFVLAAVTALLLSSPVQAEPAPGELDRFIRAIYPHGVPFQEALRFDATDVPKLCEMLTAREYSQYVTNVIWTLGYLGDARGVDCLRRYAASLRGEITHTQFLAALAVPAAVGYAVAQSGDPDALAYLEAGASVDHVSAAENLSFHYRTHRGVDLARTLRNAFVQGLGVSGNAAALRILEDLRSENESSEFTLHLDDAIRLNGAVASLGLEKAFAGTGAAQEEDSQ